MAARFDSKNSPLRLQASSHKKKGPGRRLGAVPSTSLRALSLPAVSLPALSVSNGSDLPKRPPNQHHGPVGPPVILAEEVPRKTTLLPALMVFVMSFVLVPSEAISTPSVGLLPRSW